MASYHIMLRGNTKTLIKRYPSIEALNNKWNTHYTDDDEYPIILDGFNGYIALINKD